MAAGRGRLVPGFLAEGRWCVMWAAVQFGLWQMARLELKHRSTSSKSMPSTEPCALENVEQTLNNKAPFIQFDSQGSKCPRTRGSLENRFLLMWAPYWVTIDSQQWNPSHQTEISSLMPHTPHKANGHFASLVPCQCFQHLQVYPTISFLFQKLWRVFWMK